MRGEGGEDRGEGGRGAADVDPTPIDEDTSAGTKSPKYVSQTIVHVSTNGTFETHNIGLSVRSSSVDFQLVNAVCTFCSERVTTEHLACFVTEAIVLRVTLQRNCKPCH